MDPESIKKMGLITKFGTFEFRVMPFGFINAPATFQRLMTEILRELLGNSVFVFIEDVLVCSKTIEEHEEHLRQVFQALDAANIRLKRRSAFFAVVR